MIEFILGAIMLCFFIFVLYTRRRRRAALQARAQEWAQANGWEYKHQENRLHWRLGGKPFSNTASGRQSTEVLRKEFNGLEVRSWNFRHSGVGKRDLPSDYHVMALTLPTRLSYLEFARRNSGLTFTYGTEISLTDAEFNRRWQVRCLDEEMARTILHPQMVEYLKRTDVGMFNILIEGGRLALWRRGNQEFDAIAVGVNILHELYSLIPGHLWEQAEQD